MGRLNFGITGQVRGSVNNLTFAVSRGINYVKKKATQVANPKTIGQRIQRNKMALIVKAFQLLRPVALIGFKNSFGQLSEYNGFVKENIIPATSNPSGDIIELNYTGLKTSKGTMEVTSPVAIVATDGVSSVGVSFPTLATSNQEATDLAYIVVLNEGSGRVAFSIGSALRSAGTASLSMPDGIESGDILHAYLYFKNPNSGIKSTSTHLSFVVA